MKYKYYVVYSYTGSVTGIGSCKITTHTKMNNIKSINDVRKYIAENYLNGCECIIINFVKLKK